MSFQAGYQRKTGKKPVSQATSAPKKTVEAGSITPDSSFGGPAPGKSGRKGTRKGKGQESDDSMSGDDNDSHSTGSLNTEDGEEPEQQPPSDDISGMREKIAELLENVGNKRASTREEALQELRKALTSKVLGSVLDGKLETLLEALKKCVRKGSDLENRLASECISLTFLLMGPDNEGTLNEIRPLFQDAVRNSQSETAKPSFLEALGLGCFVLGTELETTVATMDFLEEIFSRNYVSAIVTAAVDSWSLLAGTLPPSRVPELVQRTLKQLMKNLASEDNDLVIATGSALVLLFEVAGDEDLPVSEEMNNELFEIFSSLAKDPDRHKARKDRSKQRATFRDLLRSMEGGPPPEETLKFKQEQVTLDSWVKIRQVESFRHLLGEGLHVHFQQNDHLRQIFGLPPAAFAAGEPETKLTSLEKRLYYSPNSAAAKARSKWLDSKRSNKQSGHGDDE